MEQEQRGKNEEGSEDALKLAGRNAHGDSPTGVAAEKKAERAEDSGREINLALLPVSPKSAQTERREKDEKRRSLRHVLVHCKQVNQRGNDNAAAADACQSDQYAGD